MQYLIIHGSYGSPEENWFRWLEKQLTNRGDTVLLVQFPVDDWDTVTGIGQEKIGSFKLKESLESWEKVFIEQILPKLNNTPTSFIGHSIAPIFMLHMLSKYDIKLDKAVFVSPFFNIPDRPDVWQFYPVNKSFYSYDFNFNKIRSQIGKSYVIYGDNDPYVPAEEPPLFAKKLNAEIYIVHEGRHCGINFKEFPLLMELLSDK